MRVLGNSQLMMYSTHLHNNSAVSIFIITTQVNMRKHTILLFIAVGMQFPLSSSGNINLGVHEPRNTRASARKRKPFGLPTSSSRARWSSLRSSSALRASAQNKKISPSDEQ